MSKEKVKILGINGSARHATTEWGVKLALEAAESLGYVETEYVCLGDYHLVPCTGCMKCFGWQHKADEGLRCYEWNDDTQVLFEKMVEMDGLILGCPIYTLGVNSLTRIFMEKAHMFGPMSFGRGARMLAYKPCAAITVGGQQVAGQEAAGLAIWHWAVGIAMIPVGSWPTVEDPNPQNSNHGAFVTTTDARTIYGKDALSRAACRTVPPTNGIRNERCLRNTGRQVAVTAMITKMGRQSFLKEYDEPRFQSFVKYSVKPKPGSWIEKLMKEGKVIYIDKGMEGEEYAEPKRMLAKDKYK
jgi:multimeric flavodoxin WrbA